MPDALVVNVADAPALRDERGGGAATFESPDDRFTQVGINIRVLEPGQPASAYHSENMEEGFLVLSGRCLVILDVRSVSCRRGTSSTALPAPSTSSSARMTVRAPS